MNELTVFNFGSLPIRTYTDENGEPWFCLSDTCTALNIKQYRADRLPLSGVTNCQVRYDSGAKTLLFVNEPNLYRLVFRSNKPEAQKFANWVYSEVLPTIRKTGSYGIAKSASVISMDEIKKSIAEGIKGAFAPYAGEDKYFNVGDGDMLQYMQRWFWTRHQAVMKALDDKDAKIRELESKLNRIKAVI